jgi:hypothetical protein
VGLNANADATANAATNEYCALSLNMNVLRYSLLGIAEKGLDQRGAVV